MGELRLRVASTLVLIPLAVAGLWFGGVAFALLVAVGAALMLAEWRGITGATRRPWVVFALALATGSAVVAASVLRLEVGPALVAFIALVALAEADATRPAGAGCPRPAERWLLPAGVAYAGLPALAAVAIRASDEGWLALGFVFVVVWATDIGAFFAGRTLGGPKLMPKVSPKKTWSGAIGGLLAAVAAGTGLVALFGAVGVGVVFSAALLSIAGQAGDLFESSLKRRFGVKDSGNIIPGHGGILDRVDGMVVALVVAWLLGAPHGGYGGGLLGLL
jgi:phosphatidate cytidylyltransferase